MIIGLLLDACMILLIIRALVSWLGLLSPGWTPRGAVATAVSWLYRLTDPPLEFVGRFIKPIRLGTIQLDVAFIVVVAVVMVLQRINAYFNPF